MNSQFKKFRGNQFLINLKHQIVKSPLWKPLFKDISNKMNNNNKMISLKKKNNFYFKVIKNNK